MQCAYFEKRLKSSLRLAVVAGFEPWQSGDYRKQAAGTFWLCVIG
jgi:hypothetical protein